MNPLAIFSFAMNVASGKELIPPRCSNTLYTKMDPTMRREFKNTLIYRKLKILYKLTNVFIQHSIDFDICCAAVDVGRSRTPTNGTVKPRWTIT
jgi:hypothetical protein